MSTRGGDQPAAGGPSGIRWVRIAILVCGAVALYLLGRLAADALVDQFDLHLRARNEPLLHRVMVKRLAPLSAEQRMDLLVRDSPARLVPYLVRHRHLALAVLLNLPGNVLLGGGGGIALVAGMTRLFPFPAYLSTVALAVAPVPLVVSFTA